MMARWIYAIMLSMAAISMSWGMEFDHSKWIGGGISAKTSIVAEPNALGNEPGLKFTAQTSTKKDNYACAVYIFQSPVELKDFKTIEFSVKADHTTHIMVGLECEGGSMTGTWYKEAAGKDFKKFIFDRSAMKIKGNPDLSKIKNINIGFGTWEFDTSKEGFTATVAGINVIDTQAMYVIPRPTAGVAIDALYSKDWGYEDNLYNWTPPDFIKLDKAKFVIPGGPQWKGPEQLSGQFALMKDDSNIYFLAIVADETSAGGASVESWNNDSIELFLVPGIKKKELAGEAVLSSKGMQIIFDCGANNNPPLVFVKGAKSNAKIETKLVRNSLLVNGKQTSGYVLEAAIPVSAFPGWNPEKGQLLAYDIKLNDSTGVSLIATPENLKPHATFKNFKKGYLEFVADEKTRELTFGSPAADLFWPSKYTVGKKIKIWDDSQAYSRDISSTTKRIYLNSLWAVQGADNENMSPAPDKWVYMPLPMGIGWYSPVFRPDSKIPGQLSNNEGSWDDIGASKRSFFWYERMFVPDAALQGKTVRLNLEYVYKEAAVYLNGKFTGTVTTSNPSLDVTSQLDYGKPNRIDLMLFTAVYPGITIGNGTGINGDIYLEAFNQRPVIKDVWVKKADGVDGKFDIVVESTLSGKGTVSCAVIDKDGRTLATAEKAVSDNGVTEVSGVCKDFRPWSPEKPEMFKLNVKITADTATVQEKTVDFGFRRFEIKDGHFLVNNKIMRMRAGFANNPSGVYDPERLQYLKKFGFNFIYLHSMSDGYNDALYELLDRSGFMVMAPINHAFSDPETVAEIRRFRNHPSVIAYISDPYGQLDVNGFAHNPFAMNDNFVPDSQEALNLYAFLQRRFNLFQTADTTRPYISQGTGNLPGSMKNSHQYPCNELNLIDRVMYYAPWSERQEKKLPHFIYEAGTSNLTSVDATHPYDKFPVDEGRMVSRLLVHEIGARYLGNKVFDNWQYWGAMLHQGSLRGFRTAGIDGFTAWVDDDIFLAPANTVEALDIKDNRQLSYKYFMLPYDQVIENNWMRMNSWYYRLRAIARWQWPEQYGQGKIKPVASEFTAIYENEMQPFFAYIGGEKGHVYAQDHNYYGGDAVSKQLVAINDTENAVAQKFELALEVGGRNVKKETMTIDAPQGGIIQRPFEFTLPEVAVKTPAVIRLSYVDKDGKTRGDVFKITIFPRRNVDGADYAVMDLAQWQSKHPDVKIGLAADGQTLTAKTGLKFNKIDLRQAIPEDIKLLIVERCALSRQTDGDAMKNFIDRGGRALIFEQTDAGLLDWRLRERRIEHLFIADKTHPAVAGLDDADLAYLRGMAGTVTSEKRPSEHYRNNHGPALETPHLTNEGIAAAYVMDKPCYGSFTPILNCGYAMEETALLEIRSGSGKAVLCQVDVTDRYGLDPASTRLVNNLLLYMLNEKPPAALPAVKYFGGNDGLKFLDRLGIDAKGGASAEVAVIGDNATVTAAELEAFKSVVILPFSNFLPSGIAVKKTRIQMLTYPHFWNTTYYQMFLQKSLQPGADRLGEAVSPFFTGLTDTDFYFFENQEIKSFSLNKAGNGINLEWASARGVAAVFKTGSTNLILCGADPYVITSDESRRKAWRIWSMIFSNLKLQNRFTSSWKIPPLDISEGDWTFLTDPDGSGEKTGFQNGQFGGRQPRNILTGKVWEEQGVNEKNPNINSAPESAYDGFGWYFRRVTLPESVKGVKLYFEINGVTDIATYKSTDNQTTLWLNGKKMPAPVGVYNAHMGGRGARFWELPAGSFKPGADNFIAIQIFNNSGVGGIHRKPVRFEIEGQNQDMLFPYEFMRSKYTNYFFWCW